MRDDDHDGDLFDWADRASEREEGIAVVLDNEREEWRRLYRELAEQYLRTSPVGHEFTMEDVRLWMLTVHAIPQPHHPNVWPAMARAVKVEWLKAGRISPHGSVRQVDPRHDRIYPAYQVAA